MFSKIQIKIFDLQNIFQITSNAIRQYFKANQGLVSKCATEESVSKNVLSEFQSTGEIADNRNLKCFLKCLILNSGEINNDGKIESTTSKKNARLMSETVVEKFISKCANFDKEDLCEGAAELTKCFLAINKSLTNLLL